MFFNKSLADLSETTGVICFSKAWNNPVLWSHYGDKHKGICLGFDLPDKSVVPVNYEPKRLQIDMKKDFDEGKFGQEKMLRILATKFKDWQYEDEARVFYRLEESDSLTGLFYKDFGDDLLLKEVIIGPRCHFGVSDLYNILTKYKDEVKVIASRLAYRSFKVIEKRVRKRVKRKNA